MANSLKDMPAFSGPFADDDLMHVVDVSETDPQDRSIRWDALAVAIGALALPTVAETAPGVTDDSAGGFSVGSMWLDTTGPTLYMCTDATEAAAVWRVMVDWS